MEMMIESHIETFRYPDQEIQKVQVVRFASFNELEFFFPDYSPSSFDRVCNLYRNFIVPKAPFVFGQLVLFRLPEDMKVPFDAEDGYGEVYDDLTRVKIHFMKNVKMEKGRIHVDEKTMAFWRELERRGCLKIVSGKRKNVMYLPVCDSLGLMSESRKEASLKVNSSFFVMDCFDCGSVYDRIGKPFGLMVKNGEVLNPPLFGREALVVDEEGKTAIREFSIDDISIEMDGKIFRNRDNARFYTRDMAKKTPRGGNDVVVIGKDIVAYIKGGGSQVPSSGLVMKIKEDIDIRSHAVEYHGFESYRFALQVGNSTLRDGKRSEGFISPFSTVWMIWKKAFPPTLYPMNYRKDRAPRIVLGADQEDRPMLLWLEGAGKAGYVKGKESCGASLLETVDICEKLGMKNGINLDGGGSAQILLDNRRSLVVSERNPADNSESERAVPAGLLIK